MDLVQMNITGTLSPTGNFKPNLKVSPSQDLALRKKIFISISMFQISMYKITVENILMLKIRERTMRQVRYKVETLSMLGDVSRDVAVRGGGGGGVTPPNNSNGQSWAKWN